MNVADWLRTLALEQYEAAFRENDVTAGVVPRLTADDLKDLGVHSVGHRRRLLDAIAALRANTELAGDRSTGVQVGDAADDNSQRSPQPAAERRQVVVKFATWLTSLCCRPAWTPKI